MSFATLVTLTVIEIVALVVVLAIYLILLTRKLKSIALSLSRVAWGVRAVEVEVANIGPAVLDVNDELAQITGEVLPGVAEKAQELAAR